jgi:hypothetical protein
MRCDASDVRRTDAHEEGETDQRGPGSSDILPVADVWGMGPRVSDLTSMDSMSVDPFLINGWM